MIGRRFLFLALAALVTSGCVSTRPYPICFFDPLPFSAETRDEHLEALEEILLQGTVSSSFTHDGRWVLVRADLYEHRRLRKIWPRIACIGRVASGTEVERDAKCVYFVKDVIVNKRYEQFDLHDDPAHSDEAVGPSHVRCHRNPD